MPPHGGHGHHGGHHGHHGGHHGGGRRRGGGGGFFPYPYPSYYGPDWYGAERIVLVEPDKKDPCPEGYLLKDDKCVPYLNSKKSKKKQLLGLGGLTDSPGTMLALGAAALAAWMLFLRPGRVSVVKRR